MSTIKQILDTKGYAVWSIHPQESVFAAIQQMAEKKWERSSCWKMMLSSASSQNGTTPAKSFSRGVRPATPRSGTS